MRGTKRSHDADSRSSEVRNDTEGPPLTRSLEDAVPEKKLKASRSTSKLPEDVPSKNIKKNSITMNQPNMIEVQDEKDRPQSLVTDEALADERLPEATSRDHPKFIALAPVLANDSANNPYAPHDPTALAHYIHEVGQLQLHPSRSPIETPGSRAGNDKVRFALYERLFCGKTYEECNIAYSNGMLTAAAILKAILKNAPVWFEEEGVVLPWVARTNDDRKRLQGLGLNARNFPSPYETKAEHSKQGGSDQPSEQANRLRHGVTEQPQAVGPASTKKNDEPVTSQNQTCPQAPQARQSHSSAESAYEQDFEALNEHSIQDVEVPESSHTGRRNTAIIFQSPSDLEDERLDKNLKAPIRARVRAAMNVFSSETLYLSCGQTRHTMLKEPFTKYCAVNMASHPNQEYASDIIYAFMNALSPFPSESLPRFRFNFGERKPKLIQYVNSEDVLGVMSGSTVQVTEIKWDFNTCLDMRNLCNLLKCDVVLDMVVDEIRKMCIEQIQTENKESFRIPVKLLNGLKSEKDTPLLRLLVDFIIHQKLTIPLHKISDHVTDMVNERSDSSGNMKFANLLAGSQHETPEGICQHYHVHAENQPCYKILAKEQDTTTLIDLFFYQLSEDSSLVNNQVFANIMRRIPNNKEAIATQQYRSDLVAWSQPREKQAAIILSKLGMHRNRANYFKLHGLELDQNQRRHREKLQRELRQLHGEHRQAWGQYTAWLTKQPGAGRHVAPHV